MDELMIYLQGIEHRKQLRDAVGKDGLEKGQWVP